MTDDFLKQVLRKSDEIVVRDIDGRIILIPLTSGIGDMEDDLFSMNETGRFIWDHLDGKKTLMQIADEMAGEFDSPLEGIKTDVVGFAAELEKRKMVV